MCKQITESGLLHKRKKQHAHTKSDIRAVE